MFLQDSCICIDFLRGEMPNVLAMLRVHEPSDIAVPTVLVPFECVAFGD